MTLEEAFIGVWRQVLIDGAKSVVVDGDTFSVRVTPRLNLKQVDFRIGGRKFRGLEQNPRTKSRWAALARSGHKVMQFLEGGRYVAVVVDGRYRFYDGNLQDTL